jgi:hypothetical protein
MQINRLGGYSKLESLKRKLFFKKLWLMTNSFVFLPFTSWLFFVWLGPIIDTDKSHAALSAWWQFWGAMVILCQVIFCWFILMKINSLREKIENIEDSMDGK